MLRRKPLVRLLVGALAVAAGVIGLRARRGRGPDSFLPSSPMPPTPGGEPAVEPPRLPAPEPAAETKPLAEAKPMTEPKPLAEAKPAAKPKAAPKPKPAPAGGAKAAAKPKASAKPVPSRTREELYREAKRLGIEGRSKMSKGELERAVAKASDS
jgi:hypothetical protein